ncbi:MAG: response regulator [Thalassobaculaceae bacterium]|nr:response regulator [Thalassobaculaceae bacterium]
MTAIKPILLVEDNDDDEVLCLRALKTANLKNDIVIARDGAEAIDMLFGAGRPGPPGGLPFALILLDLGLPKISGLDVLKRIQEDDVIRRIPVVVMTSSNLDEDKITSYDLGANSFVRKPVAFGEFSEKVAHLGLYWLLINEMPD